jgi:hypothetical protein
MVLNARFKIIIGKNFGLNSFRSILQPAFRPIFLLGLVLVLVL